MQDSHPNLKDVTSQTLRHYEQYALEYWQGTKDHDVQQNYDHFLKHIKFDGALNILDLGCGPGRDLRYFSKLGHHIIGIDGCQTFCKMAQDYSGCEVYHQDFLDLDLKENYFHGIFANASLFHVPKQELTRVFLELNKALKDQGILFSSNPRGDGEGISGLRYGHYMEIETYRLFVEAAGFKMVEHYYRPPGLPIEEQSFLACVMQKVQFQG